MTGKQRDQLFRFHKFLLGNIGLLNASSKCRVLIVYCLDNWIQQWFPWVEIHIPLGELDKVVAHACFRCSEFRLEAETSDHHCGRHGVFRQVAIGSSCVPGHVYLFD